MKLRNLNGAIRKFDGAPTVGVQTPLGYIHVPVQKTGLLEALKGLSDDPQIETHMEVSEDGRLTVTDEGRAMIEAASNSMPMTWADADEPVSDDLSDDEVAILMGDDPFAAEDACLAASDDLDELLG